MYVAVQTAGPLTSLQHGSHFPEPFASLPPAPPPCPHRPPRRTPRTRWKPLSQRRSMATVSSITEGTPRPSATTPTAALPTIRDGEASGLGGARAPVRLVSPFILTYFAHIFFPRREQFECIAGFVDPPRVRDAVATQKR